MTDLIHKAELFNRLATAQDKADCFSVIQGMETVDAVSVTRCNDCANRKGKQDGTIICKRFATFVKLDDFCSCGVKEEYHGTQVV